MRPFRDLPIKSKLTLMLALTAAVSVALSGTALMLNEARLIKTSTVQTLTALAKVLGANSAAALTFDDRAAANETLFFLLEEHLVDEACIYDASGEVFAEYSTAPGTHPWPTPLWEDTSRTRENYLEVFHQIRQENKTIGTVFLRTNLGAVRARIIQTMLIVGAVVVGSLCAAILLGARLQRIISAPILRLAQATQTISAQGDYSVRVEKKSRDELGALYDGFNAMLEQIQTRDAELEQHRLHLEDLVQGRTRDLEARTREADAASNEARAARETAEQRAAETAAAYNELMVAQQRLAAHAATLEAASRSMKLDETLRSVLDACIEQLGFDSGTFYLVDPVTDELVLRHAQNFPEHFTEHMRRMRLGSAIAPTEFAQGVQFLDQRWLKEHFALDPIFLAERITSAAIVPLSVGERFAGLLILASHIHGEIEPGLRTMLLDLIRSICTAVANALQADDLERFNRAAAQREDRVIEMKREVNALLAELAREPKYTVTEEQLAPTP